LRPSALSGTSGATLFSLARIDFSGIELRARRTLDMSFKDGSEASCTGPALTAYQEASLATDACRLEILQASTGSTDSALDLRFGPQRGRVSVGDPETGSEASVEFGNVDLAFVSMSAELVAAAVYSWMSAVNDWSLAKLPAPTDREQLQRLVFGILSFSHAEGITTDPLFLNRVSYLVQSGSQIRNLRFDDGWKILGHLRHCLRLMPPERVATLKAEMASRQDNRDAKQMFKESVNILLGWRSWDIDARNLPQSPLLLRLFLPSEAKQKRKATTQSATISLSSAFTARLTSGTFTAEYFVASRSTNMLVIGPVDAVTCLAPSDELRRARIGVKLSLQLVKTKTDYNLLHLMSHVARVRNLFEHKIKALDRSKATANSSSSADAKWMFDIDAAAVLERLEATAHAHGLEVTLSSHFLRASTVLATQGYRVTQIPSEDVRDAAISFDTLEVAVSEEARGAKNTSTVGTASTPLLIGSIILEALDLQSSLSLNEATPTARLICVLGALRGSAPRSLSRMHRLLEDWRAEELPKSRVLFDELKRDFNFRETPQNEVAYFAVRSTSPSFWSRMKMATVEADLFMPLATFRTRAMPSLWLEYSVRDILFFAHSTVSSAPSRDVSVNAGLQIASQLVQFRTETTEAGKPLPSEAAQTIALPKIRITARTSERGKLHISSTIAAVTIKLSASVIDSVLEAQSRFGNEIDELLSVLATKRAKRSAKPGAPVKADKPSLPFRMSWKASLTLLGFKVLVESPASVQYLEADLLNGVVEHDSEGGGLSSLFWELSVTSLALSVNQRSFLSPNMDSPSPSDHKYRLAYFTTDASVNNKRIALPELPPLPESDKSSHLHIRVNKVHAVMQSGAIDALGELIDHYSEEIHVRREERAKDLKAVRERVIQTLDISDGPEQRSPLSWMERCVFSLRASSIGLAIPLEDEEIEVPIRRPPRSRNRQLRQAFLVSVSAVTFATSKSSAGFASADKFSLQFVSDFDQARSHDFEGLNHNTSNRILFPSMRCTVQPVVSDKKGRSLRIDSSIPGLEMDLDPSLVPYIFRLVDVYHLSQDRFERVEYQAAVEETAERPPSERSPSEDPSSRTPRRNSSRNISTIQATFEFKDGSLRVHPRAKLTPGSPSLKAMPRLHRRAHSFADTLFSGKGTTVSETLHSSGPDVFTIPGLTIWAEYRDEPRLEDGTPGEPGSLYVDAVIHSSDNIIYPTILPTCLDITKELKRRMSKSMTPLPPMSYSAEGGGVATPQVIAGLKIGIGLRINRSRLEISCLPITPVSMSLSWTSGGFLLSLSPRERGVSFSARVDDIGVDLRHTFSPEKCLGGNAKGLVVNASLSKLERNEGASVANFLSVTIDVPDVSGEINLRQIQDWICLKRVWIDGLEKLERIQPPPGPATPGSQGSVLSADSDATSQSRLSIISDASIESKTVFISAIVAQAQRVAFTCNFGHSIGTTSATLSSFVGRLRVVPGESRYAQFSFNSFDASSRGRLAGNLHLGSTVFRTSLRDRRRVAPPNLRVLDLEIHLGELMASLEFDYRKLLLVQSDPILISIEDHWSGIADTSAKVPELVLAFSVTLGSLSVIVTTQTVPTLVKLSVDVEKLVEERRWKARNALSSHPLLMQKAEKSRDAVTDVATKLAGKKHSSSGPKIRLKNRLHLEAERLRLVVFPHHFTDGDVFRADAGKVESRLVREENASGTVHRDLSLHLGWLSVRKLRPRRVTVPEERQFELRKWFELLHEAGEKNIFRVPSTAVSMTSDQEKGSARLVHRFSMTFGGQVEMSLNYALLKNLGDLVTLYQTGMRRVQSTGEPASVEGTPATPSSEQEPRTPAGPLTGGDHTSEAPTRVLQNVPEAATSTFKMALPAIAHSAPDQPRELEYVALENVIEQPQLNLLGDGESQRNYLSLSWSMC
jgi:hypothetical protein